MERILAYKMLSEDSQKALNDVMTALIREGWQPYGPPAVIPFRDEEGDSPLFYQAVVKYAAVRGDFYSRT